MYYCLCHFMLIKYTYQKLLLCYPKIIFKTLVYSLLSLLHKKMPDPCWAQIYAFLPLSHTHAGMMSAIIMGQ